MWISFWTDSFRSIRSHYNLRYNPIYIEATNKSTAINIFEHRFGSGPLANGFYDIKSASTLEHASAYYRGCVMTDTGWLEEARLDSEFFYYRMSIYLEKPDICVIPHNGIEELDGNQCTRCKDFVFWASKSLNFVCRACIANPYR